MVDASSFLPCPSWAAPSSQAHCEQWQLCFSSIRQLPLPGKCHTCFPSSLQTHPIRPLAFILLEDTQPHFSPWSGDFIHLWCSLSMILESSCYPSYRRLLDCRTEELGCWWGSWKSPSCSIPVSGGVKAKKGTKLMVSQPLPESPSKLADPRLC